MAKDNKPEQSPEEQLAAAIEAKRQAVLQKQAALDEAASFSALVASGKKNLSDIKDAWLLFLDAVKRNDELVQQQAVLAKAAQDHAAVNGLASSAVPLGHSPLVATSMANMADVPWPAVHFPTFYVSQFPTADALWMNIQMTLNQGAPVVARGMSAEQIARAMLAGVSVSVLQSSGVESPELKKLNESASNWFGFRPGATKAA